MTKDEALKLSMEAMEITGGFDVEITAIKESLAQPEPWEKFCDSNCVWTDHHPDCKLAQREPVVWMYQNKSTHEVRFQKHMRSFVDHGAWYEVPLYSEPLANQEKTSGSPKPAKPEALRLADAMEYDLDWCDEAAAELRRMHDLLGKANALCRIRAEEIERLKAQPEQEPVTWRYKIVDVFGRPAWTLKTPKSDTRVLESQPLYTAPPQRKPLTDEEVNKLVDDEDWYNDPHGFVRAIEAAHGIGCETTLVKGEA